MRGRRFTSGRARGWLRDLSLILGVAVIAALVFGVPPERLRKIFDPAREVLSTNSVAMPLCHGWPRTNCVIDGDTIWLKGEKIRIADINAPETSEPDCDAEAALGKRATERLIVLLNQGPFDVVKTGDRDHDKYNRELRLIERNGQSIGLILVSEGLAEQWQGYRRNWCR